MRKIILSILRNDKEYTLSLLLPHLVSSCVSKKLRQSPIYSVTESFKIENLLPNNSGFVVFCYSTHSFRAIGRLFKVLEGSENLNNIFITRGLASIIFFCKDEKHIDLYLKEIKELIIGYETWKIDNGVVNPVLIVNNNPGDHISLDIDIKLTRLPIEYNSIFNDLIRALQQTFSLSVAFVPEYISLLRECSVAIHEIYYEILFFQDLFGESELKEKLLSCYPKSSHRIDKKIATLIKIKSVRTNQIVHLHQLKDEAVQLTAIIQNFCRQALCGVQPILESNYEAGENSLLGLGGVLSALISIHFKIIDAFSFVSDVETVSEMFKTLPSPPLCDSSNAQQWSRGLSDFKGISDIVQFCKASEISPYLVYFSNRMGFKETKYSITAAYQSVKLASLPPWNLCTTFHEYVHAHIRALFSQIYPFESEIRKGQIENAYQFYCKRSSGNITPNNLFEFLQTTILSVISDLVDVSEGDVVAEYHPREKIEHSIRKWHHCLNEIIAHILDFNYFYDSNSEIYVKGIWSSWLKLPFIFSRISEYLLRTICAIASNEKGNEGEVFEKSKNTVLKYLKNISNKEYINDDLLRNVIDRLESDLEIQAQFIMIYPLIYVVKNFLISSQVKKAIIDPGAALIEDDSYSLEIVPKHFDDRDLVSPITFLQDYLKYCFKNDNNLKNIYDIEFISLWIFFAISSSFSSRQNEGRGQ